MKLELNVNRFANEDVIATSTVNVDFYNEGGYVYLNVTGSELFGDNDHITLGTTSYLVKYSGTTGKYYIKKNGNKVTTSSLSNYDNYDGDYTSDATGANWE